MFLLFSITTWFDTCLQVWNSLRGAEDDDGDDYKKKAIEVEESAFRLSKSASCAANSSNLS